MTGKPLIVIGIGQDGSEGLNREARAHLASARILAGGKRHLTFFPNFRGEKIILEGETSAWMEKLKLRDPLQNTVVLATGDPLFYGLGRLLLEHFSKEELLFLPHVSSVALAFARLKETWNDACVVSLHGRPMENLRVPLRQRAPKIALFTDAVNNPSAIAAMLREMGLATHYHLWVCENLGSVKEQLTEVSPLDLEKIECDPLNLVVLLAKPAGVQSATFDHLPLLGLPESAIRHRVERRGLITKREVRLSAICYLELCSGNGFWDIGSGSGSVSLEAARLSPTLDIFAIEKSPEALVHLQENLDHFRLGSVHLIAGEAPECLAQLPDPDAIFLGGSGGRLLAILEVALQRLKPGGRLVMTCITLETLSQAWNWFSEQRLDPQVTSLQLAHSRALGSMHCLEPENPIFLLRVKKP